MRSEGFSILAAVALHGAVLVIARAMPPLALLTASDQRELRVIDIELPAAVPVVEVPEPPRIPESPDPRRPPDPDRPPDPRVAVRAPSVGPPGPTTAEPQPENPVPVPSATQKPSQWDEIPDERRGVLGLPGVPGLGPGFSMPDVVPGPAGAPAPAPTVAPAPRQVPKDIGGIVVREAMAKHDKELGLDLPGAGNVASAVADAVRGSDIPNVSHGRIEVRIGANGKVLGVRVVSSNGGDADQWNRAASAAAARLAGLGITMRGEFAKGATVTVDVTSNVQPPAGSKGGFSGAGASFDVSNIGAHATRMVRTSFRVAAAR